MNGSARSQTAPAAALRQYGLPVVGLATFRLAAWAQLSGVLAAAGSEFVAASHIVQLLAMVLVLVADRFAVYSANQVLRAAGIATACTLAGVAVYILGPAGKTTLLLGGAITGEAAWWCSPGATTSARSTHGIRPWALRAVLPSTGC